MNIVDTSTHELAWFKSSYSGAEGGDCVEVAAAPALVHVRDSKLPAGAILTLPAQAWSGFVACAARSAD